MPVLAAVALVLGLGAWWFVTGKKRASTASDTPVKAQPVASAVPADSSARRADATPTPTTPTPAPAAPKPVIASAMSAPSATPKPTSEIEKWLAQVDGIYQPRYQQEVVAPFESGLDELKKNTLAALDTQIANASRAARLSDALAFRNERQRIESDAGVPADDSDTPPAALKTLRDTWRTQSARLETDRRQHAQSVFEQYDKVLATNQAALTQRQRLDEALQLQQRRDALKKEWLAPPPKPGTPAAATKERPFVNSLGMKFVPVPITGGPTSGQRVLFSIFVTRVKDFAAFVDATKYDATQDKESMVVGGDGKMSWKPVGRSWKDPGFSQTPEHPAVAIGWGDSHAFCEWLTLIEGLSGKLPLGWHYRLPLDHEWSCAVGIGELEDPNAAPAEKSRKIENIYPWGSKWPPPTGAGNYAGIESKAAMLGNAIIDGYDDGSIWTSPVGSYAANGYGLYDMGGNIAQFCEDAIDEKRTGHVLRGASYADSLRRGLLSSARYNLSGNRAWTTMGFRCVLAPPASSAIPAPASNSTEPARAVASVPNSTSVPSPPPRATVAPTMQTPRPASTTGNRPDAALAKATKDAPFVNSLGMKFVPVPITGGPTDKQRVLFSIWETRVQDFEIFANEAKLAWTRDVKSETGSAYPATATSWEDAQAFCVWLTNRERKDGRIGPKDRYRLPSDHEWSCAVGIGKDEDPEALPVVKSRKIPNVYPWGTEWPPPPQAGNYKGEEAAGRGSNALLAGYHDGFAGKSPVGSFRPNQFGLFDLGGNVWELCEDWFDSKHQARVARGASCNNSAENELLSCRRVSQPPTVRGTDHGFRCVVELPGP